MGLDITFHERVEWVGEHAIEWVNADGSYGECDHPRAYTSGDFPVTETGVPSDRHFDSTGSRRHWGMNYMGYSRFRACLVHTIRPDLVTPSHPYYPRVWTDEISDEEFRTWPFNELIHFTDCEGAFGHSVANKLLKDFRDHEHLIDASAEALWGEPLGGWGKRYREYMEGLEIVGPDGLVVYG